MIVLSLLLIVQIRVLPRARRWVRMLWATIFSWPVTSCTDRRSSRWDMAARKLVGVWGTPLTVLIPMLLPLLWLQLRGTNAETAGYN